jgi:hypothetical protein
MNTEADPIISVIVRPPDEPSILMQLLYQPVPGETQCYSLTCYKLVREECNVERATEEWTAPIPTLMAGEIMTLLNDSLIPPVSKSQFTETDGCSYEVYFDNAFNSAHYQWWLSPPEGWEPLEEMVELLLSCAGIHI